MSFGTKATLNTGAQIPTLGYGTWQASPGEVGIGVYEALKVGYRHLDLAKVYGNQVEVGDGLHKALAEVPGLKREDIFIVNTPSHHHPEDVERALDDTLKELRLTYLDLYLVHWPVAFKKVDDVQMFPMSAEESNEVVIDDSVSLVETWTAMTNLPKSKVRAIGVSNFSPAYLQTIIDATGVTPAVVQVERHPLLQQNDALIKYAKDKGIHITGYSAFGNNAWGEPLLIENDTIKGIAGRIGATPAQVILAWSQVGGHSVIPKSVNPARIRSNFQEVELSDEDIRAINALGGTPRRYNVATCYKPKWDINIWNEPKEQGAKHRVIQVK